MSCHLLRQHERTVTHLLFNPCGDLLFSCSKQCQDTICLWFTNDADLAGTYAGHKGTVWNCDVTYDSRFLVSASGDNSTMVWDVETGKSYHRITQSAPVRCVAWSLDGRRFLSITDSFGPYLPKLIIHEWDPNGKTIEVVVNKELNIEAKLLDIKWTRMDRFIIACDEKGSLLILDGKTGDHLKTYHGIHRKAIHRINYDSQKGFFITSSGDGTAKLFYGAESKHEYKPKHIKTYNLGRSVNCAVISPSYEHILLGGGESAESVTTSKLDSRQFGTRFYSKIDENEIGSITGHHGPLTTLAISPNGSTFASGSEDAHVRLHHLDEELLLQLH